MRIITAVMEGIYFWNDDKEKVAADTVARIALRRENLAKVGVIVSREVDKEAITISVTDRQFADLCMLDERLVITSTSEHVDDKLMRAADIIAVVAEKLEKYGDRIEPDSSQYNEKVEVYTPGMGLMLFNRTMLLQDGCSDALQAELDNGWRIIAACPQPDQRRPDYILGRYAHDDEPGAGRSALRG
jgi:hypothetical protein